MKYKKFRMIDFIDHADHLWRVIYLRELNKLRETDKTYPQKKRLANKYINKCKEQEPLAFLEEQKWKTFNVRALILYKNIAIQTMKYLSFLSKKEKTRFNKMLDQIWLHSPRVEDKLNTNILFMPDDLMSILFKYICTNSVIKEQDEYFIQMVNSPTSRIGSGSPDIKGTQVFLNNEKSIILMFFLNSQKVNIPYNLLNFYRYYNTSLDVILDFDEPKVIDQRTTPLKFPELFEMK